MVSLVRMSNVLDKQKQHDVVALGRLGWSLRRIETATGVRRETVGEYLRAAGIRVHGRGRRSEARAKAAISSPPAVRMYGGAFSSAEGSPPRI